MIGCRKQVISGGAFSAKLMFGTRLACKRRCSAEDEEKNFDPRMPNFDLLVHYGDRLVGVMILQRCLVEHDFRSTTWGLVNSWTDQSVMKMAATYHICASMM